MAGRDVAVREAQRLKAILEKWYRGTRFKASIELVQGRGEWSVQKYLRMHHHTVSRPSMGLTPCLWICKNGRSDVPGPLCNGYGGYDGVYRIITMGLANHPGRGGPITIDGVRVPQDSGRGPTWGTEWEGGLEPWTSDFLMFMALTDCALAEWTGRPLTSQLEHSTWTPRKIDRLNIDRPKSIELSRHYEAHAGEGDEDMSPELEEALRELHRGLRQDITDLVSAHVLGATKFITQGTGSKVMNSDLQKWMTEPRTVTLNELRDRDVYHAKHESADDTRLYVVDGRHFWKLHLTPALLDWSKKLRLLNGAPQPEFVPVPDAVLNSIPDA